MYLARTDKKSTSAYSLRESYPADGCLQSREIFKLGADPGQFIKYPGGNAYYFDEHLVEALESQGVADVDSCLDDLLLDFLKPEIRKIIGHFSHPRRSPQKAPFKEPAAGYHLFDKRRILFLKSGSVDQGPIGRLPRKLFKILGHKSRDEIEQYFLFAERVLKPKDLKNYIYVIFNLQRHFTSPLATRFPSAMDGEKLDTNFIEAVCRLHADRNFWQGLARGESPHAYLVRYIIMYFDNHFPEEDFMAAHLRDFRRSHRGFRFPDRPGPTMGVTAAAQALGLSPEELRKMTPAALTRYYRKMAIKLHPDQGGDHDKFIQITEAYQAALGKLKRK